MPLAVLPEPNQGSPGFGPQMIVGIELRDGLGKVGGAMMPPVSPAFAASASA